MSAHRFFITASFPPAGNGQHLLPLSAGDLHHARDVLRIGPGERVEAVQSDGSVIVARVERYEADGVFVTVLERIAASPQMQLTLVQGVAKGEKMDAIVRQVVEVGATEIVPVLFGRCVVKLDTVKGAVRAERWTRIAESAAKQAHRNVVPKVRAPLTFAELPSVLADADRVVVLWEDEATVSLSAALEGIGRQAHVALVVGPEGGLSAEEVSALVAHGAVTASLGSNILRTETAAVVAVALGIAKLRGEL